MTFKTPFEVVTTSSQALSIRDNRVGEILHNPVGPWLEARTLYVGQSDLQGLLKQRGSATIYDVGLGAGFNAMASIEVFQKTPGSHLKIYSFENDLGLFEFALEHLEEFPEGLPYKDMMSELLRFKKVTRPQFEWVCVGPFEELTNSKIDDADLIFFDLYSPNVAHQMWGVQTFELLRRKLKNHSGSRLVTYSTATRVRAAMLVAGFYVGQGLPIGLKKETTICSSMSEGLRNPLGERWLERWKNSHIPLPESSAAMDSATMAQKVLSHPQFTHLQNSN